MNNVVARSCNASHVTHHMSHVTRHTSHVTRHTPHITHHTSHVTRHSGEYLLLERPPQGVRPLASCTIFPCPHPVLGKGVLVQSTLWGNLILGPTARDVGNAAHQLSKDECNSFILSKCKQLVQAFDVSHTFHAFAGMTPKTKP